VKQLTGQHGLVVGVANQRSICWAIAQALAREGARLAIPYAIDRLADTVNGLAASLDRPVTCACDVRNDAELDALMGRIGQEFGRLDFIVHGPAFALREELSGSFLRTSRDGFHVALDVSCYSLVAVAQRAAPLMTNGGSILGLTFLGGRRAFPNYNVMGVAKAALEATVRYLASDLGSRNIRVNAISPGPIRTASSLGIDGFSRLQEAYQQYAPLRRNITAEEVADVALALLSPAGRAITGEVVMVDAGFHVRGA
jgi:enoyl-[acyl-carrier protein] reductase I